MGNLDAGREGESRGMHRPQESAVVVLLLRFHESVGACIYVRADACCSCPIPSFRAGTLRAFRLADIDETVHEVQRC